MSENVIDSKYIESKILQFTTQCSKCLLSVLFEAEFGTNEVMI